MTNKHRHDANSNIFADIGIDNPEEVLAKAELVAEIFLLLKKKKLTHPSAARIMGVTTTEIDQLFRGRFESYTVDRLMRCLQALGQDIDIVLKPRPRHRKKSRIHVYHIGNYAGERSSAPLAACGS